MEALLVSGLEFECWDIPDRHRAFWQAHHRDYDAFIYVIDAHAHAQLDGAIDDLRAALRDGQMLRERAPVLILANKQDLPGAMPVEQVASRFSERGGLFDENEHERHAHPFELQECSATGDAEGVHAGFAWLAQHLGAKSTACAGSATDTEPLVRPAAAHPSSL